MSTAKILDDMLPDASHRGDVAVLDIAIGELMPDPSQPRKTFNAEAIDRLVASILKKGIQQPLRVQWDEERNCWVILTGESRYRAARLAGLTHVPCIAVEGLLSEADRLADRLTENMVREDLPPMEEAEAIARLKALKGCTSKALVEEYGFSGGAISKAEALLTLPPDIQAMVGNGPGHVPPTTAYEISRLPDEQGQRNLAQAVVSRKLSRDTVAETVRSEVGKRNVRPKSSRLACRLEGGVSFSVSAEKPLDWDTLLSAIERLRKEARRLCDNGKDVAALAQALRAP